MAVAVVIDDNEDEYQAEGCGPQGEDLRGFAIVHFILESCMLPAAVMMTWFWYIWVTRPKDAQSEWIAWTAIFNPAGGPRCDDASWEFADVVNGDIEAYVKATCDLLIAIDGRVFWMAGPHLVLLCAFVLTGALMVACNGCCNDLTDGAMTCGPRGKVNEMCYGVSAAIASIPSMISVAMLLNMSVAVSGFLTMLESYSPSSTGCPRGSNRDRGSDSCRGSPSQIQAQNHAVLIMDLAIFFLFATMACRLAGVIVTSMHCFLGMCGGFSGASDSK